MSALSLSCGMAKMSGMSSLSTCPGPSSRRPGRRAPARFNRSGALLAISAAIQPPIEQPMRSTLLEIQAVHQLQVDVGDVFHAIQPIRQAEWPKPGCDGTMTRRFLASKPRNRSAGVMPWEL